MQQVAKLQTGRPFAVPEWLKSSTDVLAQRVTGYGSAWQVLEVSVRDRPTTASESTVSNTELRSFSPSPSSGERTQ